MLCVCIWSRSHAKLELSNWNHFIQNYTYANIVQFQLYRSHTKLSSKLCCLKTKLSHWNHFILNFIYVIIFLVNIVKSFHPVKILHVKIVKSFHPKFDICEHIWSKHSEIIGTKYTKQMVNFLVRGTCRRTNIVLKILEVEI